MRVVELTLPATKGMRYLVNPIPAQRPVKVVKTRLIPPPFRCSREEAEALLQPRSDSQVCAAVFSPWELAWGGVLYPGPEDEIVIRQFWESCLSRWKEERDGRVAELDRLKQLPLERRQAWFKQRDQDEIKTGAQIAAWIRQERASISEIFDAVPRYSRQGKLVSCGRLKLKLKMILDGEGGIMEAALQEKWLQDEGMKREQMAEDHHRFLQWIRGCCGNADALISDARDRSRRRQTIWNRVHDMEQLLSAKVRYAVHFADGSVRWFSDIQVRPPMDRKEARQLEAILKASEPGALAYVTRKAACDYLGVTDRYLRDLCRDLGMVPNALTVSNLKQLERHQKSKQARKARSVSERNRRARRSRAEE